MLKHKTFVYIRHCFKVPRSKGWNYPIGWSRRDKEKILHLQQEHFSKFCCLKNKRVQPKFVKKHAGDAKICILCIDTSNSTFWKKYWWCWQVVPVYIKKEIKPDFCDTIIFYIKWLGMIQHFPDWVTGMDIKCQAIWQQRSRNPSKGPGSMGSKNLLF